MGSLTAFGGITTRCHAVICPCAQAASQQAGATPLTLCVASRQTRCWAPARTWATATAVKLAWAATRFGTAAPPLTATPCKSAPTGTLVATCFVPERRVIMGAGALSLVWQAHISSRVHSPRLADATIQNPGDRWFWVCSMYMLLCCFCKHCVGQLA